MLIKHAIWTVGDKPTSLPVTRLATEQVLEDMIKRDRRILSDATDVIGRHTVERLKERFTNWNG